MADPKVDRDARLNIRVSQDVLDRMHALASKMGIPAATLGAVAISEYLTRNEMQERQIMAIAASMSQGMNDLLKGMVEQEGQAELRASAIESIGHVSG